MEGLVYWFGETEPGWQGVRKVLRDAFQYTQRATQEQQPTVYILALQDLMGRQGPLSAMISAGLLSGARTAALELDRVRVPVNVLVYCADATWDDLAIWVLRLMEPMGPTGAIVHMGSDHIGKALL